MILEKLAELEKFVDVPNVNKSQTESLKGMVMLNLIVEIRGLVKELEKPLPTDEQIDFWVHEFRGMPMTVNPKGLRFKFHCAFVNGARWMRNLIRDKSSQVANDIDVTSRTYTAEDMEEFSFWYHRKVSVIGESELHLFGVRPFGDIIDFWKKERRAK